MASSPDSAPPTDSDSPPAPPTESSPSPSSSPSPPAPTTSSPSPSSSPSLSPPTSSSPPPPKNTPSPPSPDNNDQSPTSSSPPPPSSSDNDTPRPPSDSSSSSMVPPPPPHSRAKSPPSSSDALSPPSHSKNTSTHHSKSSPSSQDSSDLPVAAIVGITVAVLTVFIVFIAILGCCCMRKKKKRSHDHMQYYDPSHMHKGSGYYNSGPNWYNTPQKMDHVVKVPPPPGAMGPPGAMWASPPPQPMHSSDMSSNFSGPHGPPLPPPSPSIAFGFNNKSTFSYDELAAATDGFSQANLLGQGGFGYVYKGKLPNGKEIAVKQLKSGSGQGEREFQAEVEIISRVHHRHLVSLVGYCIAGEQRILVYEFVPNNTLEYHLHGEEGPTMDFPTRLKIALGSAKGLAYLHEDCHPKIIHRDIKTANILLDYNFEAMVADFGLAKLSSDTNTHVSTRVMGTFGYLAPEYASSGKLTEKSDVFSYGVMLLELITGRRPVDSTNAYMDDSLVDWARPILSQALEGGNYGELIDPRLQDNYDPNEMMRMMASAAACVRHSAKRRPKMSQMVRLLEGDVSLQDLNEGVRPGHSTVFGSMGGSGSEYDSTQYNADMRQFRKVALATQGFSSEYSGHSSDYSRPPSVSPSVRSSEGSHSREVNQRRSP